MIQDRKKEILQAARELFAERPYEAVTVKDIQRRAQASNGSFFFAFANKSALATTLYAHACRARDRLVEGVLAEGRGDPRRAFTAAIEALVRFLASPDSDARLLRHLRAVVADEPAFRDDPDGLAGLTAVLTQWVERSATRRKQITPLPPSLIAILLLTPARLLAENGAAFPERAQVIDQLSACLWNALAATPGKKPPTPRNWMSPPRESRFCCEPGCQIGSATF